MPHALRSDSCLRRLCPKGDTLTLLDALLSDWPAKISTALSAAAGVVFVQIFVPMIRDNQARQRHARYLAMRLAVGLEGFASACCTVMFETIEQTEMDRREEDFVWKGLPVVPELPKDDEGWRAIDPGMANLVLNLPNKVSGSAGLIRSTWEYSSENIGEEIAEQAAKRGLEAWQIAVSLRHKYDLGQIELVWEYPEQLEKHVQLFNKNRSERNSSVALV
jgi:hypothetical protein